ncbi:hypothetical protein BHM03_00038912 [Ensete ventricosum]|nr:hypothetical protein BHM03_00038912 [Ensete ventricosum]
MGNRTSTVLQKNAMVIKFVQSRLSISFSCIASSLKEHPVVKKLAEEHPVVKKPMEAVGEEHPAPAVKKLAAAREEHPSPTVNAPAVKKSMTVGEEHPVSRVSFDFSCTVSEIQNIGRSQRISP